MGLTCTNFWMSLDGKRGRKGKRNIQVKMAASGYFLSHYFPWDGLIGRITIGGVQKNPGDTYTLLNVKTGWYRIHSSKDQMGDL